MLPAHPKPTPLHPSVMGCWFLILSLVFALVSAKVFEQVEWLNCLPLEFHLALMKFTRGSKCRKLFQHYAASTWQVVCNVQAIKVIHILWKNPPMSWPKPDLRQGTGLTCWAVFFVWFLRHSCGYLDCALVWSTAAHLLWRWKRHCFKKWI